MEFLRGIIARLTKREGRAKAKMNRWLAQTSKDSYRLLHFFSMNNSNCSDDTHSENRQHHDEGYFLSKSITGIDKKIEDILGLLSCSVLSHCFRFHPSYHVLARAHWGCWPGFLFFIRNGAIIPCGFTKKFVGQKGLS